jgi:DNA invertase Pin-like site-specific DNA recombinase
MKRIVGVNERGLRVGEDHQHARLTDAECELIRQMHEAGMSYKLLADKFEVGKSTIADICKYRRRGQHPVGWRRID